MVLQTDMDLENDVFPLDKCAVDDVMENVAMRDQTGKSMAASD